MVFQISGLGFLGMDLGSNGVSNFAHMPASLQPYNNHLMSSLPLQSYLPPTPLENFSNPNIVSSHPIPQSSYFPTPSSASYPVQLQGTGVLPSSAAKVALYTADQNTLDVVGVQVPSLALPVENTQSSSDPSAAITLYRQYYTDVLAYFKNLLNHMERESSSSNSQKRKHTIGSAKVNYWYSLMILVFTCFDSSSNFFAF